ncbi:MAG TPA: NAD(P)H-hydrate dehydratase [Prolixibacteraceae bacterium]|nr:NAD(P)H-hydrate dehydratase [Prolixibacteraceae bacterium]
MDRYTIENEPIADIDLMERASKAVFSYIIEKTVLHGKVMVFCGPGNNGGDGLAVARMLAEADTRFSVEVYLFPFGKDLTASARINLERLRENEKVPVYLTETIEYFPVIPCDALVIDALFGSGVNRPLSGLAALVVERINRSFAYVLSIDMPSGLLGEDNRQNFPENIIHSRKTLTFQFPKLSFLLPENEAFIGDFEVLDIGLHPDAIHKIASPHYFIDPEEITMRISHRKKYSHKGHFGHALLIAGSYGKMGAAILASKACLRSGAGLLTVHVPHGTYPVVQTAVPEAMCEIDDSDLMFTGTIDLEKYSAVAIGPAIGQKVNTQRGFHRLINEIKVPLIVDADGINVLGINPEWLNELPEGTILTPHPKEFSRVAGEFETGFERVEQAVELAKKFKIYIVLKGAHTAIACPTGDVWFNSTGNPGMATAGSGDVLTGIILALLAQSYSPKDAAIIGVYIHGLAGDRAKKHQGEVALIASDIIENLGELLTRYMNWGSRPKMK